MKMLSKLMNSKKAILAMLAAGVILVLVGVLYTHFASALAVGGFLIYSDSTTTPQKREWQGGTSFAAEAGTLTNRNPYQVVTKVSPVANSIRVMGLVDSSGTLDVLRSTDGGQNWTSGFTVSLGGTGTTRRFDIAFEQSSGEVVVAYSKNATTNEIGVRRYNGSWQTEATYDPGGTSSVVTWVELAEKSGSDELALGYVTNATATANIGAGIWNGSTNAFGNFTAALGMCDQTAVTADGVDKCMDIVYETNSGLPTMVWGISGGGNVASTMRVTRWNGTSWAATSTPAIGTGDDGTYVDCEANPESTSNEIACGTYGASTADVQAFTLNAGVFGVAGLNRDTAAHAASAGKSFVATTYVNDGSNRRAVVAWADADTAGSSDNQIDYTVFNGSSWATAATFSKTFGDDEDMLAVRNPVDSTEAVFLIADENSDLWAARISLSGTTLTWSNADGGSALETSLANIVGRAFDFAYNPALSAPAYDQSAYGWYTNANSDVPGSILGSQNTPYTLTSTASPIRLRTQLTLSADPLWASSQAFKLQYATSTSGPWTDVGSAGSDGWCNDTTGITCTTSWGARRKITLNNSASSTNLTDFPVLVKVNSSRIDYAKTQSAGQDIRFVDPSDPNTVLPHEIETWNESGDSYVWVKVPQINASSTTDYIWMYYDNASASDGQDDANVWNSNYKGVWHSEETTGTSVLDSTSNNNDGTKTSATSPNPGTGKVGGAQVYNGTDSHTSVADANSLDLSSDLTVSAWINASALGGWRSILCKDTSSFAPNYCLQVSDTNTIDFNYTGSFTTVSATTTPTTGTWYYVTATLDDAANTGKIYINGTYENQNTNMSAAPPTNTGALDIGEDPAGEYWSGTIDEVRVSSGVQSADWIEADYLTQTDAMNSFGSEQTQADVTPAVWGFYNNATPADGVTLTTSVLTGTNIKETYQESNPTPVNPNAVNIGQKAEWDFSLDPTNAINSTTYYFRMTKSDGTALGSYTQYPQITISTGGGGGPTLDQQMRGGQAVVNGTKSPFSF